MATARDQAREAALNAYDPYAEGPNEVRMAEAASDVWEAVVRDIIRIASAGKICPSDAAVIRRAQEALGGIAGAGSE